MKRYLKIWWLMALAGTQENLSSRFSVVMLIFGKIIRFFFFFFFLIIIGQRTKLIGGYTLPQIIFIFLSYQLIDTIPQFFLREVYRFRRYIVTGDFDYFLTKPFSTLFRSLFGWTDVLDRPIILMSIVFLIVNMGHLGAISVMNSVLYITLLLNAFCIALSFHIFVVSLGILTTEVDSAILLYRDLTAMGRIPVDIYQEPLRSTLTFVVPVGIMMTFPAKALLGLLSAPLIAIAMSISGGLLLLSLSLWRHALRDYVSASS